MEVECANCGEVACLHGQPVTDVTKVLVGSKLVSCRNGYFKGEPPTLATVVKVKISLPPYKGYPISVKWEGSGKEQLQWCPLPSSSFHLPTFTYCCRGVNVRKGESERKERERREVSERESTGGWGPGAWGLEWTRGGQASGGGSWE